MKILGASLAGRHYERQAEKAKKSDKTLLQRTYYTTKIEKSQDL